MSKRDAIRAHYDHRFSPEKANHEILDWASAASQQRRFEVLVENVDLAGMKLLDVGCGLGDLLALLQRQGIEVDYTGVDILQRMIDHCRKRFDTGRFLQADIFSSEAFEPGQFDLVFTSGAFNLDLGNNLDFLPVAIDRLLELSRRYVVFNLLHARWPKPEPGYFFYDPQFVLRHLARRKLAVRLIDDYLPNDFTVICRKRQKAEPGTGNQEPGKQQAI
jgi:SAM-dependent methyltransferase